MSFVPRGSQESGNSKGSLENSRSSDTANFADLVDRIADAVREKLISQGVPLPTNSGAPGNFSAGNAGTAGSGVGQADTWKAMLHSGAERIGHTGDTPFQPHILEGDRELAHRIDHTLLKPDATPDEIKRICEEARKYDFATVCVNSSNIAMVAELLKGTNVKPIAVVGFPLGAAASATKAFEAREAVRAGAREIDMVLNIGKMKGREYAYVLEDIRQVVDASKPYALKVILETSNLTYDEKVIGCALSKAAGAAFVKTSTGFGTGGATAEDVQLMRRVVGPEMGVKASGGIRTYEDAAKMLEAGASRIGASASVSIVMHEDTKKSGAGNASDTGGSTAGSVKKPHKSSLY